MDAQPSSPDSTRQGIQACFPEHHTDGQTHQNRAGCKRQHVVRILRRFSDRELRHRLGRDDDDDSMDGTEWGGLPPTGKSWNNRRR